MFYKNEAVLKNGKKCIIRNAIYDDGQALMDLFIQAHGETDFLLSYPEEHQIDVQGESEFLQKRADSLNEVMVLALVDQQVVAMAGVSAIGNKYKVRHRAELGINVSKAYWGLGIGQALMSACVECAKKAGYKQLELEVVADNIAAIHMYQKFGFIEFGRNPMGFISKYSGFQELVYMRLEL